MLEKKDAAGKCGTQTLHPGVWLDDGRRDDKEDLARALRVRLRKRRNLIISTQRTPALQSLWCE